MSHDTALGLNFALVSISSVVAILALLLIYTAKRLKQAEDALREMLTQQSRQSQQSMYGARNADRREGWQDGTETMAPAQPSTHSVILTGQTHALPVNDDQSPQITPDDGEFFPGVHANSSESPGTTTADGELVAVLTAAVAATLDTETPFRVVSFRKSAQTSPAWNLMGRHEYLAGKL
ncbi:MAG: hypothetical protein FWH55_07255 [Oscillospiraceae bacterium]|nr:hypothetical protein [Oscillospiraceae bacterium]